jgi:hypothetical protein
MRALSLTAVVCVAVLLSPCLRAAEAPDTFEAPVKAAFLYHFTRFVEWPGGGDMTICVVGADPFGPLLEQATAGKKANGRDIRLSRLGSLRSAESCSILFATDVNGARLASALGHLRNRPVLTVSDAPGFAVGGGIVGFVRDGNHVRLEVNTAAAEQAGLHVSSRLLSIARVITEKDARN